ncbi:MAG: riboflavin biosynthesis protein [Candidatus Sericytochromatia bacterium]|nr:MAG: riboflavin biosynthesis protein [Candidatus Sericytochromatia bacterium]
MRIFNEIPNLDKNTTIAIGTFDGVHYGHRQVLSKAKQVAKENNQEFVIFTFTDHPAIVTGSKEVPKLITVYEEKLELLKSFDADICIIYQFDKKFSNLSPEDFIENILIEKLKAKNICVGFNFFFGYQASGNIYTLKNLQNKYNYNSYIIEQFKIDNTIVSSSEIRKLILDGNFEKANKLLGYEYSISGRVIKGKGIGKSVLGIPTANLDVNQRKILPKNGVYSCFVKINNDIFKGVMNIGNRPTLDNGNKSIEVHIINFDKNIYDHYITITFKSFIRDEKKFNSLEELKEQILKDIESII